MGVGLCDPFIHLCVCVCCFVVFLRQGVERYAAQTGLTCFADLLPPSEELGSLVCALMLQQSAYFIHSVEAALSRRDAIAGLFCLLAFGCDARVGTWVCVRWTRTHLLN